MSDKPLYLPSLRGRIGDWRYYVTCMPFAEVAKRIKPAEEVHQSESLNELIQRELTKRSKKISSYLTSQPQHFFNSIVVGVYGGSPEWLDIALKSTPLLRIEDLDEETVEYIDSTLGLLKLTGQEGLFAMDGQHRVEAIRQALTELEKGKAEDKLEKMELFRAEEVSVILVGHERSKVGLERTRRLFSTLNKYAKPVSLGEIVALDEDDGFAIVTRRLVEDHPLFKGKRSSPEVPEKQTRITRNDKRSFTSILAIYDIAKVLSIKRMPSWSKDFLTVDRPSDAIIDSLYQQSADFWNAIIDSFPQVREYVDSNPDAEVAGKYRTDSGGHLLFRPIGQMAMARAIRMLIDRDIPVNEAVRTLSAISYELSSPIWVGVLWNSASSTMLTNVKNRDLAAKLMLHYGGYEVDQNLLLRDYRTVMADPEAQLPQG